jgi:hypothetical protein
MARLCQTTRSIKEAVTPGYALEHCEWSTGGEKVHALVTGLDLPYFRAASR